MRWLLFIISTAGITLSSCLHRNRVVYSFENNRGTFEFQATNPDTVIKHKVNFWTMEVNPGEPVQINFIFAESIPNVEKLKSITGSLFDKQDTENSRPYPSTSELKIDFYDGKKIVSTIWKNNSEQLNKLIDWKKVNYTYQFMDKEYTIKNNLVHYNYSCKFETAKHPDTLKFVVNFNWENGERNYESLLIKGEYTPPGLNIKF